LDRFAEALLDFDRAIALNPGYGEAYYNRGGVLLAQQQSPALESSGGKRHLLEQALASFDRALAIGPEFAELFAGRGLALRLLERYEDGLASYERALALRADFPDAQEGRTLCQAARSRADALHLRL
jgi:tetratricopeptide (TPR) repeat protein